MLALLDGGEDVDERLGDDARDGSGVTSGGGGAAHHGKCFACLCVCVCVCVEGGMEERSDEIKVLELCLGLWAGFRGLLVVLALSLPSLRS